MSGLNLAANMYGMFPNTYNNQVALNDLCDMDLYSPMGAMGMNGSIFNPGIGAGYPVMPMYGGTGNYQDYYQNYEKYQDFMVNNQIRRQQKMRNADLRLNSPQEGIAKQAAILKEKIMQNEQQQIIPAYQAFVQSVKNMYGDASPQEVANRASALYSQMFGTSVTQDIRQYGRDSFTQGMLQTLTFGIADKKTAEENVSELTGQPVSRYDKAKKIAGNATGGALLGVGGAIGLKFLLKGWKPIGKAIFRIPVLAAIGGVAAGIMAFAAKD